jgi:hypothetical protein
MTTMIVDDLGRIPMSPYLTATLTRAADYATAQSHREVTLEHLLLALAEDPEATIVLKSSNVDLTRLTAEVSDFLGRSDDRTEPANGEAIAISADLKRILEAAAAAARQGRRREINGAIVLAAIVGDGKSTAAHLLRVQGLTFEEAIRALQRVPAQPPPAPSPPPQSYQPPVDFGEPPKPDLTRPATPATPQGAPTTEEILASARERLRPPPQHRPEAEQPVEAAPLPPPSPSPLPRANYPDLGGPPPRPIPAPAAQRPAPAAHDYEPELPSFGSERPGVSDGRYGGAQERYDEHWEAAPPVLAPDPAPYASSAETPADSRTRGRSQVQDVPRTGPPTGPPVALPAGAAQAERRRTAGSSGPFVGSWPLIEAGQLVENIPRRMRVGIPVVVEARIARADVKALAEGLQGGGAAFRHEVVVTKAMSVRLRAPDGGFSIENRSPETQWIESVLGLGSDDFASWRWTVTPRTRGRRQLQLIVSARTVGSDGMTAETALPDQLVDVKVAINYTRTLGRWTGWILAAVIGGLLAKFGEMGYVILKLLAAKYLGI